MFLTQTIIMVYGIIFLIILFIFLLIIFFFPFKIKMMSYFDLFRGVGFYCFSVLKFKILCGRVFFSNGEICVQNQNNRFQQNPEDTKFFKKFFSHIYKNFYIVSFNVYYEGGIKDNAAVSAVMCGTMQIILSVVFSFLKSKNCDSAFEKFIIYCPLKNECNYVFEGTFSISIFSLLKSFIISRIELNNAVHTKYKEK